MVAREVIFVGFGGGEGGRVIAAHIRGDSELKSSQMKFLIVVSI